MLLVDYTLDVVHSDIIMKITIEEVANNTLPVQHKKKSEKCKSTSEQSEVNKRTSIKNKSRIIYLP